MRLLLKNGTADFGTADVTISAENPIKIVAQKQRGMVVNLQLVKKLLLTQLQSMFQVLGTVTLLEQMSSH